MPYSTPDPRCGKWSSLLAQADPGGDPSRVHDPRGICLQRPRTAVVCCDVRMGVQGRSCPCTPRMGVQGRFLDASGLTQQPKYNLFRGAALHRLTARARRQKISAFEPLKFVSFSPHQFLIKSPHQMQFEKICTGVVDRSMTF